jgi:hypothetical protein
MRCEDIDRNLNSETGDIDEVFKHLEICPTCAQKYAAELGLETALRQLSLTAETVDISENLKSTLYNRYEQQYRFRLIRKWTWLAASLAAVMLLIINLPAIIEWFNHGYNLFINELSALKFADNINLGQLADKAQSSRYYEYFVIFVLFIFVGVSACLWREVKEIFS